jgi:hypothetical protein
LIESSGAIYSKATGQPLVLAEDDRSLYSQVRFYTRRAADGAAHDNAVWLAQWYLDNLNALYTAPLDHELWRRLDRNSPIASRLYEYLLPVFFSPAPLLRINYPHLAQSLPVRVERYLSDAKRQIGPALHLLRAENVLSRVDWSPRKDTVAQLLLHRGRRLERTSLPGAELATEPVALLDEDHAVPEAITVRESRTSATPAARLVADFYRLWQPNAIRRPAAKELAQAADLVGRHGFSTAQALLPLVIRELKQHWPDAKTFAAVTAYLPQALDAFHRQERAAAQRAAEQQSARRTARQAEQDRLARRQLADRWQPVWDQLSPSQQLDIRSAVVAAQPWLVRMPSLLAQHCLSELARRSTTGRLDVPTSE